MQLKGGKSTCFPIALTASVVELKTAVADKIGVDATTFRFLVDGAVARNSAVLSSFPSDVVFKYNAKSIMTPAARAALHVARGETRTTRLHQEHVQKSLGSLTSTTTETAADVKDLKSMMLSNSLCTPPEVAGLTLSDQRGFHDKSRVTAINHMQTVKEQQQEQTHNRKMEASRANIESRLSGKSAEWLQLYAQAVAATDAAHESASTRRQTEASVGAALKDMDAQRREEKKAEAAAKRAAAKKRVKLS